ncbi:hypothetical protein F5887DRAFT_893261 [Amanita rubescens]|nr:hypothetical protein F5887DRAFT_893261 [Amanita rubescens]
MLRERYLCPYFRILVIGRANAGKTTILENFCGVAKGTKPIIYDKDRKSRGLHDIEHEITYPGSNFIFHDSKGFESGSTEELEIAWKFIKKKSTENELKNQLHAIWYCIPMDSPRPILHAELEFFNKGTGRVPLVVVFTKFDGQITSEFVKLNKAMDKNKRWNRAREIAEITFQNIYLPKVLDAKYPPKACVRLEDIDLPTNNCAQLTQKTADVIDDGIHQLFVSTQMNDLDLSVKSALQ